MNFTEAINYIESLEKFGIRLGLETIGELLSRLGNPQEKLKYVHVAGTNGKGSVSTMVSAMAAVAGYKTGLYTSPALCHFAERIRIDGAVIDEGELTEIVNRIVTAAEAMVADGLLAPTRFEIETSLALLYFAEQKCDLCVIEVGMGGRLDATNTIPAPEAAVIMEISDDHSEYLGDTPQAIAGEKAGIIKTGSEVVLYPNIPEVEDVVLSRAEAAGCALHRVNPSELTVIDASTAGQTLRYSGKDFTDLRDFRLKLLGNYQVLNCLTALKVIAVLNRRGYSISAESITGALANVTFPGRFEILHEHPVVLIDGAHNPAGIAAFAENIRTYFLSQKIHLYFGMLADKDIDGALEILMPLAATISTLTPTSDRALSAEALAERIYRGYDRDVVFYDTMEEAVASLNGDDQDAIYAFVGSLYLIGHVREAFCHNKL